MKTEKGVTLIELVVVIFLVVVFSVILVADFPRIQKQFALSRAAYNLAQNLRKAEDLGLSGVAVQDSEGNKVSAAGFGVYINLAEQQHYVLYADSCPIENPDWQYTPYSQYNFCIYSSPSEDPRSYDGKDFPIKTINVNEKNYGIYIKTISNIYSNWTSINFTPPNPYVSIANLIGGRNNIEITLSLRSNPSMTKVVSVNTSGLIEVK